MADMRQMLTYAEAAEYLGVSYQRVAEMVSDGKLTSERVAGLRFKRIDKAQLRSANTEKLEPKPEPKPTQHTIAAKVPDRKPDMVMAMEPKPEPKPDPAYSIKAGGMVVEKLDNGTWRITLSNLTRVEMMGLMSRILPD